MKPCIFYKSEASRVVRSNKRRWMMAMTDDKHRPSYRLCVDFLDMSSQYNFQERVLAIFFWERRSICQPLSALKLL